MTMNEYKEKLGELITREDAIKAACRALCEPGVFCPDNYCCEIREAVFAIPEKSAPETILKTGTFHVVTETVVEYDKQIKRVFKVVVEE